MFPPEEMDLKVVEKLALGFVAALLLCCVACIAVLWLTDFGSGFFRSSGEIAAAARGLNALDAKYPFETPSGAGIPAGRMEPFLAASCQSKSAADALEAFKEQHGTLRVAGQPVYKDEGARLMTAYLKELTAALDEARMGPEEFHWIHQRIRLAAKGPPSPERQQEMQASLETLRKLSEDPQTPEGLREDTRKQIELLETLPDVWGPPAQADHALYQSNLQRIQTCNHGNRAVRAMSEFLVLSTGKTRISIEVDPEDDSPEQPASPAPPAPPAPPSP